MAVFSEHRAHLDEAMEQGRLWLQRSPWIRRAAISLPREDFAPTRLWHWDGHTYVPIDRGSQPERWANAVYGDPYTAAVTQVTDGLATSSLSCQSVVVDMLDSLLLDPGHRVLELGTGTGWNAALLAQRAGPGMVTSVETDTELALRARSRLRAAGVGADVRTGDGGRGWPAGGPYDRVISTYAVDDVPWAWVAQTRPGGRIVTPWGRLGHVALTVADDGRSATGWVQGLAQFMPARGTGSPAHDFAQVRGTGPVDVERDVERDLKPLRDSRHLLFGLRVAVPDLRITTRTDDDGVNAWLHDNVSSWAALSATATGRTIAYQGGPRRLADELEGAWDAWTATGSPTLYDYAMTVTPDGQYVRAAAPASGPSPQAPGTTDPVGQATIA